MADRALSRFRRFAPALGPGSPPLLAVVGIALLAGGGGTDSDAGANWTRATPHADAPQVPPGFTHADHEAVDCETCHTSADGHGSLSVTTVEDCRVCHHRPPLSSSCASCHSASDAPSATFDMVRAVSFSVGTRDPARTLTFAHPAHAGIGCARCHTEGMAFAVPADLDCQSCHQDHHTPQSDCASCHRVAPVSAHPPSEAHVTCSGAACHQRVPFQTVPRTRDFCLGCHQNMREHEAPRACAECHQLPAPRPQPGGGA